MNGRTDENYKGYKVEIVKRDGKANGRAYHKYNAVITLDGRYRETILGHTEHDAMAGAKDWIDRMTAGEP